MRLFCAADTNLILLFSIIDQELSLFSILKANLQDFVYTFIYKIKVVVLLAQAESSVHRTETPKKQFGHIGGAVSVIQWSVDEQLTI